MNSVPISHLVVLTLGDIDKDFGGWVFNIEKFQDCGSVVRDGGIFVSGDHFIHASGS